MDWELREWRVFLTAVEVGSFTDAAADLGVSQAAVSRTIAALERKVGDQLLRRVPHGCEPTGTGQQVLPHVRRALAEADNLAEFLRTRHQVLRLGYAWAALGKHTVPFQRAWASQQPEVELQLVPHSSPTSGLAEGTCDVALVRHDLNDHRFDSVVVGLERRLVAFAADDPSWSRRRRVSMTEIAGRTVVVNPRISDTFPELWDDAQRPEFLELSTGVDGWLDAIAAGRGVGMTAEATAHYHVRPGVIFRPISDGPRVPVRLVWHKNERPRTLIRLIETITELYENH